VLDDGKTESRNVTSQTDPDPSGIADCRVPEPSGLAKSHSAACGGSRVRRENSRARRRVYERAKYWGGRDSEPSAARLSQQAFRFLRRWRAYADSIESTQSASMCAAALAAEAQFVLALPTATSGAAFRVCQVARRMLNSDQVPATVNYGLTKKNVQLRSAAVVQQADPGEVPASRGPT
jgi:hypothetical protein